MRVDRTAFFAVALLLAGCRSIPTSEPGSPRTELEVQVDLDPRVSLLLAEGGDLHALQRVVSESVLALADVGMRFYPVPSDSYEEDAERPEYYLTVLIQDVGALLDHEVVRSSNEISGIRAEVEGLQCSADVTLFKRRDSGPALQVGKALGKAKAGVSEASATMSSTVDFSLKADNSFGVPPSIRADDLARCVSSAVGDALRQLVQPIDREFNRESDRESDEASPTVK